MSGTGTEAGLAANAASGLIPAEPMRWQVGDVRITKVVEVESSIPSKFLFGDAFDADTIGRHGWLRPHYVDDRGRLKNSIHCFIIESRGHLIAVDTCLGNDKIRLVPHWHMRQGAFLQQLAEAGFSPAAFDAVVCTHLHVDHVGWNTRLQGGKWVPTFPKAKYLFGRSEWDHWHRHAKDGDLMDQRQVLEDSVEPIFNAGAALLVEDGHRLTDEVWLESTPGHTPGHMSVRVSSNACQAVITGDLMHHPVQCCEPEVGSLFDFDPQVARKTRRDFLEACSRDSVLLLGTHFPFPTAGWLRPHGVGWELTSERSNSTASEGQPSGSDRTAPE